MNIVFVKHGKSKPYCFAVPEGLVPYIKKNMTVLVQTYRGLDIGTTTTNVISGEGAKDVAEDMGAYFPLKPVVSFLDERFKEVVKNEIVKVLRDIYDTHQCSTELPF